MIMLRMTEFEDLNGVNSKCKEMILERQIKWIPDNELWNVILSFSNIIKNN